jgi:hypothetical protein
MDRSSCHAYRSYVGPVRNRTDRAQQRMPDSSVRWTRGYYRAPVFNVVRPNSQIARRLYFHGEPSILAFSVARFWSFDGPLNRNEPRRKVRSQPRPVIERTGYSLPRSRALQVSAGRCRGTAIWLPASLIVALAGPAKVENLSRATTWVWAPVMTAHQPPVENLHTKGDETWYSFYRRCEQPK